MTSNVIGAAAYYGHVEVLKYCISKLNGNQNLLEFRSIETKKEIGVR